jgi:hypothetical protein
MRKHSILVAAICLALGVGSAAAEFTSDGRDTQRAGAATPTGPGSAPCSVLWFTRNLITDEIARLSGLGLLITTTANPADLNAVNLANYDVLVVAYAGGGVIGSAQPVIQAYVTSGHGLLIHQPNLSGSIDYAPAAFEVNVLSPWWCGVVGGGGVSAATIVDGSHAITTGLANADLSGDFDYVGPIGPGYTVLARNVGCGSPALAAGTILNGRVVLETGNGSAASGDPGSNLYWSHVLNWLCTPQMTPAQRDTWGRVKLLYR